MEKLSTLFVGSFKYTCTVTFCFVYCILFYFRMYKLDAEKALQTELQRSVFLHNMQYQEWRLKLFLLKLRTYKNTSRIFCVLWRYIIKGINEIIWPSYWKTLEQNSRKEKFHNNKLQHFFQTSPPSAVESISLNKYT